MRAHAGAYVRGSGIATRSATISHRHYKRSSFMEWEIVALTRKPLVSSHNISHRGDPERPRDPGGLARTRARQQFSGASSGEAGERRAPRSVVRLSGLRVALSYMGAQAMRPGARPGECSRVLPRDTTLTMRDEDNARRKANEY